MKRILIIFTFTLLILACKKDNKIPTANAGIDQSVKEGATVSLDGSASTDQDADVLSYKWTAPSGITLSSETEAQPTFTAPEVTTDTQYTFSLVVNDGKANSLVDEVTITVTNEDKFLTSIIAGQTDGIGIKYVDFEPDTKLMYSENGQYALLKLDLNKDSIDDFELRYTIDARSCCYSLALTITPLVNSFVCDQKSDTTLVEALAQGDNIDNSNNWLKSKSYLFYYWYSTFPSPPDGTPIISEKIYGSWYNHDNIYMGVKIIKEGKELFGWIDVNYLFPPGYTTVVRRFAISQPY